MAYGVAIWGSETEKHKRVFRCQKKALRLIFGIDKSDSCRGLFSMNNMLTFPCLFILECLTILMKNQELYQFRNQKTCYRFRNSQSLSIPHHKTTNFERQTYYTSIKLFNALPTNLRQESEIRKFRNNLKRFLIEKEYYTVQDLLNNKPII